ncbi:MAG: class I SAM-dependent methyltransferase family protein [Acidimicrobiia bacterium]|nr:class I SAM-dependent methyltransferase family protein [Acidimicrobiia bacterium]
MALRDYVAWHDEYGQPGSRLHLRLLVVQDLIALALDDLPPGPIRVLSLCAGQGHDLLTVARRHRRGRDLTGRLVELDPHNVAAMRTTIEQAGLDGLEVVEGDAGVSDSYAGAVPADLVLTCGIFGNISDEDIEATVAFLPALCSPGAWVVWTRQPRAPDLIGTIEGWSVEAGFEPRALVVQGELAFGVGAARLVGDPMPFRGEERLFTFVR